MTKDEEISTLRAESQALRAELCKRDKAYINIFQAFKKLEIECRRYSELRDFAGKLVRDNDAASKSAGASSGTGHQTPAVVINSVLAWKSKAVNIAEKSLAVVRALEKVTK